MKLYEKVSFNIIGEEDQLVLHLSEPNFTLKQRAWRRIRQFYSFCREFI